MAGRPERDRVEPGARQQRQPAVGRRGKHQGQRPRPEARGERVARVVEDGERLGLGQPRHMDDQRVEARPALGRENLGDGASLVASPPSP